MHDIIVALVFVTMVAAPAIVAAFPVKDEEEGLDMPKDSVSISIRSAVSSKL